jgi:hypothetical protein
LEDKNALKKRHSMLKDGTPIRDTHKIESDASRECVDFQNRKMMP